MTEEQKAAIEAAVQAAGKAYRRAKKAADDRRDVLAATIRQAYEAGVRQSDIARASGYTREYVARVLKDGSGQDPVS